MSLFILGFIITWILIFFIITILFFIYRFYFFFRDPVRIVPDGNNIVSPADGVVLYIREIKNFEVPLSIKKRKKIYLNELVENELYYHLVIGIYMTPFSVHFNRFPFSGVVNSNYYKSNDKNKSMMRILLNTIFNLYPLEEEGEYILENERNIITVNNEKVDYAVVQIADKWIRKIDNRNFNKGDMIKKGEKIGLIRMGSQCDLFLNIKTGYKIKVKEGDYVKAGETILIELE